LTELLQTLRLLRELRSTTRASPETLASLQSWLLRETLDHAYVNSPHYRSRWDELGVRPADIRGPGDLARLPITSRNDLREGLASGGLLAGPSIGTFASSGSSGSPLSVPRGVPEQRLWRALALRMWLENGDRLWQGVAHLDAKAGPSHGLRRLGVATTTWISTDLPVDEQTAALVRSGASVWVGTPTVLGRIAEAHEGPAGRRPRLIVSQGEILDVGTRALIRRTFGRDPADVYGLTEVGYVAWQCEQRRGLHVNADAFVVEVLRDGRPARPGELGTVVVTGLRSRTIPLVRYDTGDLAIAADGRCACGRTLPLLGSHEGRARDTLVLANGRVLTARAIVDHLDGLLLPTRYALRQEATARFRLHLDPACSGERETAVGRLRELVGDAEIGVEVGLPPLLGDRAKSAPVSSHGGFDASEL
jgi:phenylacetate-CoA ligase